MTTTTYTPVPRFRHDIGASAFVLPAAVTADLRCLAARLGVPPSAVVEGLLAGYLEVLELTEAEGGLGAWLDRVFEAEHDDSPRERITLVLPDWQQLALTSYAAAELTSPSVALTAMIGRTLREMVSSRSGPDIWVGAFTQMLAEHRGEFLAA